MQKNMRKRCFISMNKKSQAALEFLTTYAWAFLVIIIMIASLAYFGVLKPSKILPDRCNFGAEMTCVDYRIDDAPSNVFNLRLKNNAGEPIVVDTAAVSSDSTPKYSCTNPAGFIGTIWPTGEAKDLAWTACNTAAAGFVAGEKAKE